jgi:[ribosomal protein S18]-alanine N-acetyltransferase
MARNYNLHLLTLAQVAILLRVDGSWPGSITLSSGWSRARARPWNQSVPDPMVRVDRGGRDFLASVLDTLYDFGAGSVYSPALFPGSTRLWRRSGFDDYAALDVMERSLLGDLEPATDVEVRPESNPDWDQVLAVDQAAFEGFWLMSRFGLAEAHETNRVAVLLTVAAPRGLAGYTIVGSQWGTAYLHRIAVHSEETGRGVGTALLHSAIAWSTRTGARTMVLNVRPENTRAKQLYEHVGFKDTGTSLRVLRHEGD